MNIDGIGIDIVQIKRIKLNFVNKFLVGQEVDIFNNILDEKEKIRFLAGRFAAKEAIIKATDKSYLFSKMEILSKEFTKNLCNFLFEKNYKYIRSKNDLYPQRLTLEVEFEIVAYIQKNNNYRSYFKIVFLILHWKKTEHFITKFTS